LDYVILSYSSLSSAKVSVTSGRNL
jgi:hypothetical protein